MILTLAMIINGIEQRLKDKFLAIHLIDRLT